VSTAVHALVYVAATLVLLHIARVTWHQRAARAVTATSLAVVVVGAAWWSLADAVIAAGVRGPVSGIAALSSFPAIAGMAAGFVCLARSMDGTGWVPRRRFLAALAVEPLVVTLVAATNPWHLAFYGGPGAATLSDSNHWEHGTLFWVHTAYSYGLFAIGLAVVAHGWWRSSPVFRRQSLSLLLASLIPGLVNVVNLVGMSGDFGDPTPIGFALAAGIIGHAILRQELIALAPVAREVLFARISDAVIALSPDGRIIDLNQAAEAILRATTSSAPEGLFGSMRGWSSRVGCRRRRAGCVVGSGRRSGTRGRGVGSSR